MHIAACHGTLAVESEQNQNHETHACQRAMPPRPPKGSAVEVQDLFGTSRDKCWPMCIKGSEIYYQLQKHASVQLGSHKYPNQGTTDHGRPRDATGSLGYGISEKGFWDLNFATLGPLQGVASKNGWVYMRVQRGVISYSPVCPSVGLSVAQCS